MSSSSGSVLGSQGGYGSGAGGTGTMTDAGQGGNSIMGGAGGGATRGNNTAASLGGTSLHGEAAAMAFWRQMCLAATVRCLAAVAADHPTMVAAAQAAMAE